MDPNAVKAFAEVLSLKNQLAAELAKATQLNKQSAAALVVIQNEAKTKPAKTFTRFVNRLSRPENFFHTR